MAGSLAAAGTLSACGGGSNSGASATSTTAKGSTSTTTTTAAAPKTIKMSASLIGLPPLAYALWANVAKKEGYFTKLGLTMTFKYNGHGTTVAKMVVSNTVDITDTASTANATLIANGTPDVLVMGMNTEDWQIGTDAPGVTSCKDLKGQTIGTDGTGNARELFVAAVLKSCGLTITDVTQDNVASVPADMEKAAIAGQLHTAVFHVNELSQVQSQAKTKWISVPVPKSVIDDAHYTSVMVSKSYLSSNRQAVVRFVAAKILAQSWIEAKKNLTALATLASTLQGTTITVEKSSIAKWRAMTYWAPGLGLTKSNINGMVQTLVSITAIPKTKAPTYTQLVTTKVYNSALKLAKTINPTVK
ncbi:MAG: ABC transporter substrate-binding protein [Acidimicrobiales bacterium]